MMKHDGRSLITSSLISKKRKNEKLTDNDLN